VLILVKSNVHLCVDFCRGTELWQGTRCVESGLNCKLNVLCRALKKSRGNFCLKKIKVTKVSITTPTFTRNTVTTNTTI
jgi:hypothetical protein